MSTTAMNSRQTAQQRGAQSPIALARAAMSLLALAVSITASAPVFGAAEAGSQKSFATPQAAVKALGDAARKDDQAALSAIFGAAGEDLVSSGDPIEDQAERKRFLTNLSQRQAIVPGKGGIMILEVGKDRWPFPVPLVKRGDGWVFDTKTGAEEILNRRIGRNEIGAIATAQAFVDAQREFAAAAGASPAYAQRMVSTSGKHDGLYWPTKQGEKPSPLGPLVAEASAEGYNVKSQSNPGGEPRPYHGYRFRILKAQGPNAPGGAKSYVAADGSMTGGFALLAYPAEYGVSGIMTFVVNRQGIVFQKDLGASTAQVAGAIQAYDPDDTWTPTRS